MKTFISRSIPFKDIMKDLSEEMKTSYHQFCEEYSLEIPEEYGQGTIRGINFTEGIGILMYDCEFKEDLEIQFIVNEVHPLKFIFCEKGELIHRFEDDKKEHFLDELQSIIVASNQNKGHIMHFKANVRTKINSIEIDRKKFLKSKECEIISLHKDLKELFLDVEGKETFYYAGNYSLQMADAFAEIEEFEGTSFSHNIFFHSQAYRLLTIQIMEYKDVVSEDKPSMLLQREIKNIRQAAQIIEEELGSFGTIQDLALRVGLNVNKLQNGFQKVYGTTINGYVQNKRLSHAGVLIRNTDLSFSEIADRVGISSKSYFSKIFKDQYGKTPSEIRENQRKLSKD